MVTEAQLTKPGLIVCWDELHRSTVNQYYVSATVRVWVGYQNQLDEAQWFGTYDYSSELPNRYYVDLVLEGFVASDHRPDQGIVFRELFYKQVDATTDRAKAIHLTLQRINKRVERWKRSQSETATGSLLKGFEVELRALCWAVNAQSVCLYENGKEEWADLDKACTAIAAKGSSLALQCRLLTGRLEAEVKGYTNAPENYDQHCLTVAWLPYTDNNGQRFREVIVNGAHWLDQLGRNQSGGYQLYQENEFERLKSTLKTLEKESD